MRYRQKPNGMWVVDYEDDHGARKRISTGIKTEPMKRPPANVTAAGRDIILGLRSPRYAPVSSANQARKQDGRMTVSALLDKCELTIWHPDNVRSQTTVRSNVKILNQFIGDVAIEDVTYTLLEQLVADMKARGYQPATIQRKLASLKRALRQATMWTDDKKEPLLQHRPPFPQIKVSNLKERIISPTEETALFNALEKRRQLEPGRQWFAFRVFLTVDFDTGGRLGELVGLGPHHITSRTIQTDDGERTIHYLTFPRYRTKSGKPRTLPLAPRSVEALGTLMDHLTLDSATQEWRFFGFSEQTAGAMFRDIRQDVIDETGMDVADVTIHTIRHTVLTRLAQGGMDLARLQMWAGHADPKITAERYLHLIPSDLDAGLAILGTGGTKDGAKAGHRTKHGSVSDTFGAAISAKPGTVQLQ